MMSITVYIKNCLQNNLHISWSFCCKFYIWKGITITRLQRLHLRLLFSSWSILVLWLRSFIWISLIFGRDLELETVVAEVELGVVATVVEAVAAVWSWLTKFTWNLCHRKPSKINASKHKKEKRKRQYRCVLKRI